LGIVKISEGNSKYDVVRELTFNAAIAGLHPFAGNLVSIKIDSESNTIKAITKDSALVNIKYKSLRVFNPDGVTGMPFDVSDRITHYEVYDWFDVRSGTKHSYNALEDSENLFVQKIFFYLSERIDGNTQYKDLVSKSILSKEELHHPDYSDSMSRLKTIAMMRKAGIKGTSNGSSQYLPIKIELYRREIHPNKQFDFIAQDDIIIDNRTGEQIINEWVSSCRNSASGRSVA
tara:strand:- start:281 stop:976 length:696 start_codon:yes stop_codon:yes gene_type:complete